MRTSLVICWAILGVIACGTARAVDSDDRKEPGDNAALWYWRCFNELQIDAEPSKRYIAILLKESQADNEQELAAMRERWSRVIEAAKVAVSKPYCSFAIDRQAGLNALLPHLEPMRRLARMIGGETDSAIERGDLNAAAKYIDTMCGMAAHVMQDGIQISALVAVSICNMAFERVRRLADTEIADEAIKASLRSSLDRTAVIAVSAFADILAVEREMTSLLMLQWWDGPEDFDDAVRFFKAFGADPIGLLTPDAFVNDLKRFDAQLVRIIAAAKAQDAEAMTALTRDARALKHGVIAGVLIIPYEKTHEQLKQIEGKRAELRVRLVPTSASTRPATP